MSHHQQSVHRRSSIGAGRRVTEVADATRSGEPLSARSSGHYNYVGPSSGWSRLDLFAGMAVSRSWSRTCSGDACNTTSQFNDPKFQPILDRLKGTVSMSGKVRLLSGAS
jgi:hypothetical protein